MNSSHAPHVFCLLCQARLISQQYVVSPYNSSIANTRSLLFKGLGTASPKLKNDPKVIASSVESLY